MQEVPDTGIRCCAQLRDSSIRCHTVRRGLKLQGWNIVCPAKQNAVQCDNEKLLRQLKTECCRLREFKKIS
jgi:RNase P protein component